jgi:hypothetical protein
LPFALLPSLSLKFKKVKERNRKKENSFLSAAVQINNELGSEPKFICRNLYMLNFVFSFGKHLSESGQTAAVISGLVHSSSCGPISFLFSRTMEKNI